MNGSESKVWTLGISDTGDKYHLIYYDDESDTYNPVCQVHARNLQPINNSKVEGKGRICANCEMVEDIENILFGVKTSRYSVVFENPDRFRRNHPTS